MKILFELKQNRHLWLYSSFFRYKIKCTSREFSGSIQQRRYLAEIL